MPDVSSQDREEALKRIREEEMEDLVRARAEKLGIGYINLQNVPLEIEALKLVTEAKARNAGLLVFAKGPKEFSVAVLDPERPETKAVVKDLEKFGRVNLYLVSLRSFEKYLEGYRFVPKEREKLIGEIIISAKVLVEFPKEKLSFEEIGKIIMTVPPEETSELTQKILASALSLGASDIHLESAEDKTLLRYRIDGVLYHIADINQVISPKIRDRLKLLAELKLNIQDTPQDGRFTIKTPEEEIEVRASTVPGPYGENIVLRLLLPSSIKRRLEDLGIREYDLKILNRELKRPNGLIAVTGPTGSGKTTTLYAALKKIVTPEIKIITIEDPIEYHVAGIEQTQIDAKGGYDFANGLRAILRQDPDVILVGEIRDRGTASTAMHASLTGHLVFTTLHTNDAAGAVPRLVDLGVEPKIIASAMNVVIAQRLSRRLCPNCARSDTLSKKVARTINQYLANLPPRVKKIPKVTSGTKIKKAGKGCADCYGTGYRGRMGIFEVLLIEKELAALIHTSPTESDIYQLATRLGMVTMMQDAILKMLEGVTDIEEIERVVGPI